MFEKVTVLGMLSGLDELGVEVWVEGERLRVNAPAGVLTPALRSELAERKAEILRFLGKAEDFAAEAASAEPPIVAVDRSAKLALSFAQQRLWLIDQIEPGNPSYNISAAFRLEGDFRVPALAAALSEIIRRHEVLRTTFPESGGDPEQAIGPPTPLHLPVVDLRGLPPAVRRSETERLVLEDAYRPFDLVAGPLMRTHFLLREAEEGVIFFSMHHIISDGWSVGILIQEVAELYRIYSSGGVSPLEDLAIQYVDFAHWQQEWLQGEVLEQEISYWRDRLAGAPPILTLPIDRPRVSVASPRGANRDVKLPAELSRRLETFSQQQNATPFMTLMAAFHVLLGRYSGQTDVSVGTPIAGRTRVEVERLIGFFVNALVIRSDQSGSLGFRDFLRQVRGHILEAYQHQHLPFEKLVAALEPERTMSHAPLFQVVFSLQNLPQADLELEGLSISQEPIEVQLAKFDLSLTLTVGSEGLEGGMEYNIGLFDETTIVRMLDHYEVLLEGLVADPERAMSSVPLLRHSERHQLAAEWNDTVSTYPQEGCIHQLFELWARRTPQAPAVEAGDGSVVSYGEMESLANRLAHCLRRSGVGPEARVGVCVEDSPLRWVAVLAVLKAGGAYVPLDPGYPDERLGFLLKDSGALAVLAEETLKERLRKLSGDSVEVLALGDLSVESSAAPPPEMSWRNSAYMIYTSGSTGRPKGALLEHRGLVNLILESNRLFEVSSGSRVLQFASFSFDVSVWEAFMALSAGATLVLGAREAFFSGQDPETVLRQRAAEIALLPASLLRTVQPAAPLPRLKTVVAVGEWCAPEAVAGWAREGRLFFNGYGPAEVTVTTTAYRAREGEHFVSGPPIGRPLAHAQVHVLSRRLASAPVGASGELYLGGIGVGRGYLGRRGLTAERFVPDLFNRQPGARLYRTGDRVRWLASGNLEFVGRVDQQVKIRGFRIEPREIESVLGSHPGVDAAVVVPWEDGGGDRRLVAYVVAQQGNGNPAVGEGELRPFLWERLPEYMVPWAFVPLEELPRTPNGKIDLKALPNPARGSDESQYIAPRSEVEEQVAEIWSQILGIAKVGAEDNFFTLGGHSLLATQVVSRIREIYSVELPLRDLFESPTVASTAESIEAVLWKMKSVAKTPSSADQDDDLEVIEL